MNKERLYEICKAEENASFEGWDFSRIAKRMITDKLRWSYKELVKQGLRKDIALLDMGTGGGELLSSFAPLPERTFATESYEPNIPVARRRLEPLGVDVREINSDDLLPFPDCMFDQVINSHESYNVYELKRIMKKGGMFLTQQVGCNNLIELTDFMGITCDPDIAHWKICKTIFSKNNIA